MYISVLYVVFTYGLRSQPRGDVPFASYLVVGIIPWMYFSEMLNIIKQYSYLVKKINFRLSIVKIISSVVPHVILMLIAIIVTVINGKVLSFYSLQLIYFFICMVSLLFGISLITSSLNLFLPDTAKFISVVTQFGFWLTPILWDINKIPERFHWLLQLNPMEYIVTGYRNSLLYDKFIIQDLWQTIYFWGLTFSFIVIGSLVFRKFC